MVSAATLISGPYLVALVLSMVEHALESRFAPGLKGQAFVSYVGLAMVVLGEGFRKLAVVTANKSFTHDIKVDKRQEHKLVTHGIYRYCWTSFLSPPVMSHSY
jgi:protein-S-isoprenylcysteine O-methyltransferase